MQDLMTEPITSLKTDAKVLLLLCHGIQWIEFRFSLFVHSGLLYIHYRGAVSIITCYKSSVYNIKVLIKDIQ